MTYYSGKTAFITGAASGIGFALCKALSARGANVMMADIDAKALELAASNLQDYSSQISTCICDVSNAASVKAAAGSTLEAFGKVHIAVNNAGVGLAGNTGHTALEDWRWIVDINLLGVVYGVEVFAPLIRAHGEGGHIINTASMAGHFTMAKMSPYHATKFAVVGYSESLAQELSPENIHVSVLCPTWIKTKIADASDKRPSASGEGDDKNTQLYQMTKALVDNGMEPDTFAELVLEAAERKQLYVFNDPEARAAIDTRRDNIQADYDASLSILKNMT